MPPVPYPNAEETLLLKAALLPDGAGLDAWLAWRSTAAGRTMAEANSWLSPLLYRALIKNGVPESEIPELRATYQATRARNQTLLGVARKMAEQFHDAGISFMFIKGSAMLAGHYGDPGVRVISDVDLLVREDQFARAVELLRSSGWESFIYAKRVRRIDTRFTHALQFFHPPFLSIDLHCRPLREVVEPDGQQFPWDAAVEGNLGGLATRIPCAADLLTINCIHGSRPRAKRDLRWIADACVICRGPVDWNRVREIATGRGMAGLLVAPLTVVRDLLGMPIPETVLEGLTRAGTDPRVAAIHDMLEAQSSLTRLRSHPPMLGLSGGSGQNLAFRALAYLMFWCQVNSVWEVPGALVAKAARRVAFTLGLFDYEAPIKRFLQGRR